MKNISLATDIALEKPRVEATTHRKGLLVMAFLTGLITLSMRSLIVSPFYEILALMEQGLLVFLAAFLVYALCMGFVSRRYALDAFDLVIFSLAILPLTGAIASHVEYGQPLVHGILAFKDYYLFFVAYFLYYLLRREMISLKELENALMWSALISLFMFYLLSLTTNPAKYADTIIAGSQSTKGGGVYYRFNMGLIFYGAIYFFVKAFKKDSLISLIICFLFVVYILFFRLDRTSMVACLLSMGLAWLLSAPRLYKVKSTLYFGIPGLLIVALILTAFPSIIDRVVLMFWDAISTLIGENKGAGQAKLRNYEAGIVIDQIKEHPILGNGRVSNTWVPGAFDYFYRFFYPSDVGFLGTVFVFGIPGTVLLYSQFFLSLFTIWHSKWMKNSFAIALVFYLLILFLDSLSNGSLIIFSAQTLIPVMCLYYMYKNNIGNESV